MTDAPALDDYDIGSGIFSVGCRVQLTPRKAPDYVILSRRGDISGKCRRVGRLYIHWITNGGVRMKNLRADLIAS